jgi:transposase
MAHDRRTKIHAKVDALGRLLRIELSEIEYCLSRMTVIFIKNAMPSNVSSKKIKRFRRIATRYDKTARMYLTGILFVSILAILKL